MAWSPSTNKCRNQKRPDGEHQEQQMGQIAEQVQELKHAAFQLQRSPAEKSRQEQEFQEKDPQMSQEQHLPPAGTGHGPEGIVLEISRRQQGKTEQEYSGKSITHGRNHLRNSLIVIMTKREKDVKHKKPATKVTGRSGLLELLIGFEPTTLSLRMRCSTN